MFDEEVEGRTLPSSGVLVLGVARAGDEKKW